MGLKILRGKKTKTKKNTLAMIYDLLFIPSEFFLCTSAIDFNEVHPSNNTFNRQKIIITIFVNETKSTFEKNLKKKTKKTLQN